MRVMQHLQGHTPPLPRWQAHAERGGRLHEHHPIGVSHRRDDGARHRGHARHGLEVRPRAQLRAASRPSRHVCTSPGSDTYHGALNPCIKGTVVVTPGPAVRPATTAADNQLRSQLLEVVQVVGRERGVCIEVWPTGA